METCALCFGLEKRFQHCVVQKLGNCEERDKGVFDKLGTATATMSIEPWPNRTCSMSWPNPGPNQLIMWGLLVMIQKHQATYQGGGSTQSDWPELSQVYNWHLTNEKTPCRSSPIFTISAWTCNWIYNVLVYPVHVSHTKETMTTDKWWSSSAFLQRTKNNE